MPASVCGILPVLRCQAFLPFQFHGKPFQSAQSPPVYMPQSLPPSGKAGTPRQTSAPAEGRAAPAAFWADGNEERLHFYLLHLGGDAIVGRIARDEPLFDSSLESAVKCEVDAPYCGAAQAWVALATPLLYPATLHQVLVELLEIMGGKPLELDLADAGNGVGLDNQLVAVSGGRPNVGLGVELIPAAEPGSHCVVLTAAHIQTRCLLLRLGELLLDLGLRLAEDVLDDPLAGF